MTAPTLFSKPAPPPVDSGPATLFADVVFDRPLDSAYSYAVPPHLEVAVAVGKRVEVPFGRGDRGTPGYVVRVSDHAPDRPVKAVLRVLDDVAMLDDGQLRLTRWMADYYLCGWGQVLHAVVPAGAREQSGTKAVVYVEAVPTAELPPAVPTVTARQKQALDKLRAAGGPVELGLFARTSNCGTAILTALVAKKLARKFSERVENGHAEEADDAPAAPPAPLALSPDQARAWDAVKHGLDLGGYRAFLLHGVTCSGKTEVYLRAIEEVVKRGQEAIVLVPEISLTPQTTERFRGRCGRVAVLHSNMTDAERGAYWRRIAAGQTNVVVGARSAVFAPTRKLGLIVIDEEHETSFKQESTPRYHARDVALMRARLAGVPILLGSATPSLESWQKATSGEYTRLDLPSRVEGRPMPPVRLVDLRTERKPGAKPSAVSPTLEDAMKGALAKGGQVMLLLNRRGFSTHVHCPACGHVAQCQNCDLALTFHRTKAALACHYCGWETAPMTQCPACQKGAIRYQGLGTEKLQAEIEEKFPGKVVQRMDSDTMARPGSHQRVLDAFREGLIHILLGTQMIAKGLDFPNVTLVGVINADVGLHLPDFRAAERTFQLLAQVAGRAGRGDKPGLVMVQTFTPDHPGIALASKHDYPTFAAWELKHRQEHLYPPFQRMARLIVRSEREGAASEFADTLAGAFREAVGRLARRTGATAPPVRVLGPAECPVFKLNTYYRFHFQLQGATSGELHDVLREVLAVAKPPHGVEFQVDVDPFSMM